jgi:hypothetical protein
MVSLHNYYLSTILELEFSIQQELVVNYVAFILLKDLQIVQFIENVNTSLQLDWNGVLKCLWVYTYKYHYLYIF